MLNMVSEYLKLHNATLTWYPNGQVCLAGKECRSIMSVTQLVQVIESFFSTVELGDTLPSDCTLEYLEGKSRYTDEITRLAIEAMEDDR